MDEKWEDRYRALETEIEFMIREARKTILRLEREIAKNSRGSQTTSIRKLKDALERERQSASQQNAVISTLRNELASTAESLEKVTRANESYLEDIDSLRNDLATNHRALTNLRKSKLGRVQVKIWAWRNRKSR